MCVSTRRIHTYHLSCETVSCVCMFTLCMFTLIVCHTCRVTQRVCVSFIACVSCVYTHTRHTVCEYPLSCVYTHTRHSVCVYHLSCVSHTRHSIHTRGDTHSTAYTSKRDTHNTGTTQNSRAARPCRIPCVFLIHKRHTYIGYTHTHTHI